MNKNSAFFKFFANFSYTFIANIFQMVVSAIVTLVLPRYYNVEVYSYWQLYLLYYSYIGIFHLGWSDGIYLRYAGKRYEELDKRLFSSQFWYLVIMYLFLSMGIYTLIAAFFSIQFNLQILIYVFIAGLFVVPRTTLFYILQGTNRISDFAKMNILEKLAFVSLLLIFFFLGIRTLQSVIFADLLGKLFSLLGSVYLTKDIVFSKLESFSISIKDAFSNMNAGIKLMIANIASTLIIGIIRFSIERNWGLEVFGKISLTLTISNLLMVFINSLGIVIFPMLKRISEDKLKPLYIAIRNLLMLPLLGILVFYYPMQIILSLWLPQYAESLRYMALLFPLVVFESKTSLLINTYLKALRKEKIMLYNNVMTVLLSFLLSYLTIQIWNSLTLTILLIVFLLAFRAIIAEAYIGKILRINVFKDIVLEVLLSVLFMFTNWNIGGIQGVLLYSVAYIIYVLLKKDSIKKSLESIKSLK